MGHDDLKVKGDLHVEDKLKVDHDAHFKDDVQVDDRLTVSGRVNLGDVAVTQITSISTAVTVNSASGVITAYLTGNTADTGVIIGTFVVNNSKVLSSSVVLLSVTSTTVAATGASIVATSSAVSNGSFTVTLTNASATQLNTASAKVNFLVC